MTFIPAGYAEASLKFEIPGDAGPAYCVFGVLYDYVGTLDEAANAIKLALDTSSSILEVLSNEVSLTEVRLLLGSGGGPQQVGIWTGSVAGGEAANAMTPQVSFLMRKTTGFAGREYSGRMYLPGVNETAVDSAGNLSPSALASLVTAGDTFISSLVSSALNMVLLHTEPELDPTPVITLQPQAKVATQRRRLR